MRKYDPRSMNGDSKPRRWDTDREGDYEQEIDWDRDPRKWRKS